MLFIVAAPSGAGKTSLTRALAAKHATVAISVSHTTRPPRPGEADGRHYYFVDEKKFRAMADAGAFLEHAKVFGHRYGTARAEVERRHRAGRDVILEIDWQGARQVRAARPDAVGIFILPPSRDALAERLKSRGQDAPETITHRMQKARAEIAHYDEFPHLIVNDDFDSALARIKAVVVDNAPPNDAARAKSATLARHLTAP